MQKTKVVQNDERGFTLIELLIVIGIVAILAVVVVLTINPAELLRQARDSNRISDMGTLRAALSLYLSDISTPVLETNYNRCSMSAIAGTAITSSTCGVFSANITTSSAKTVDDYRKVNGSGWIPVNFNDISSGAPLGNLPIDPVNNATYYYAYAASSSLTFEINANMESSRYRNQGGASDVESTDGGNNSNWYEAGTAPGLAL